MVMVVRYGRWCYRWGRNAGTGALGGQGKVGRVTDAELDDESWGLKGPE